MIGARRLAASGAGVHTTRLLLLGLLRKNKKRFLGRARLKQQASSAKLFSAKKLIRGPLVYGSGYFYTYSLCEPATGSRGGPV